MQVNQLLNEIIQMLGSFRDDRKKLEKLHQYILEELYKEPEDMEIKVPEKYRSLIRDIANSLDAGFICYLHPKTLEKEEIPADVLEELLFDMNEAEEMEENPPEETPFYEVLMRVQQEWEDCITISPPESYLSFEFMEGFLQYIQNNRLRERLSEALSKKKPFRHFKAIIEVSAERENWFAYKQKCLERYTIEQLAGNLPEFVSE